MAAYYATALPARQEHQTEMHGMRKQQTECLGFALTGSFWSALPPDSLGHWHRSPAPHWGSSLSNVHPHFIRTTSLSSPTSDVVPSVSLQARVPTTAELWERGGGVGGVGGSVPTSHSAAEVKIYTLAYKPPH